MENTEKKKPGRKKKYQLDGIYNKDAKLKFLEKINSYEKSYYERLFTYSKVYEEAKGKDLSQFKEIELHELYSYINANAKTTIKLMHSKVLRYMKEMGRPINDLPRIKSYTIANKANKIVMKNKLITREELLKIIEIYKEDETYNPIDAFLALASFEGILGKQHIELINLKKKDIYSKDGKYYAKIDSGNDKRTIEISQELYYLGKDAIDTDRRFISYYRGRRIAHYIDSPYIVKKVELNTSNEEVSYHTIRTYVVAFLKATGVEKYYTLTSLNTSGKIEMIKEKAKEKGITLQDYISSPKFLREIVERYGGTVTNLSRLIHDYTEV